MASYLVPLVVVAVWLSYRHLRSTRPKLARVVRLVGSSLAMCFLTWAYVIRDSDPAGEMLVRAARLDRVWVYELGTAVHFQAEGAAYLPCEDRESQGYRADLAPSVAALKPALDDIVDL